MAIIVSTERLELCEMTTDYAAFIIELLNSPGWLQYIGDRKIKTTEDACNYVVNGPQASYRKNQFGLWLVKMKIDGTPIGICGLIKRDTLPNPDLGFAFLPQYEGKGFAFEASQAVINHATNILAIPKLAAITTPHNNRSMNLLRKLGFDNKGIISFSDETEQLVLWEK